MIKIFPETNPCGQLFNDFIQRNPIITIYSKKGRVIWQDEFTIEILINGTNDCIHISHQNGIVCDIKYETSIEATIKEMQSFLKDNLKKKRIVGKKQTEVYNIKGSATFVTITKVAEKYSFGIRSYK